MAGGVAVGLILANQDDDPQRKTVEDPVSRTAIQGDIDGDGLGDIVYYFQEDYDDVVRVTGISDGEAFELSELAINRVTEPTTLHIDWDGDGVNEPLTWSFVASGKQIALSSTDADFPGQQTSTLSLSSLKKYGDLELQLMPGDFDGDGDIDLAVAGQNDKFVDVSVLSNDGAGTFSKPVLWLSIPNAVLDSSDFVAGDFDNDGRADLWAELPASKLSTKDYRRYYSGDRGYALLTSSGTKFSLGAINKTRIFQNAFLVGDVTGDGRDHIVGVQVDYRDNIKVTAFDVSSGQIKEVPGFTGTAKIGDVSLQSATLSDVDGDGKGDVVFVVKGYDDTAFSGIQVMKSTGAVFDPATVWAQTPDCATTRCRIEFAGQR